MDAGHDGSPLFSGTEARTRDRVHKEHGPRFVFLGQSLSLAGFGRLAFFREPRQERSPAF